MKKLAILFLLTAVIVSFTFAQVSLKADFSIGNVNKGNDVKWYQEVPGTYSGTAAEIGYADPVLVLIPHAIGSQELGPGTLGFEVQLGIKNSFYDTDYIKSGTAYIGAGGVSTTDDTWFKGSYTLGVGPGKLGFGIDYLFDPNGPKVAADYNSANQHIYYWTLRPNVSYSDIALGPVALGVGLKYAYKFNGMSTDNATGTTKGAAFFHPYGDSMSADQIQFWFDVNVNSLGLYIYYEFDYGWGKDATGRASWAKGVDPDVGYTAWSSSSESEKQGQREIVRIAYLDIQYKLGGLATLGLEVDDTGPGFRGSYVKLGASDGWSFNTETVGFTLKPKADFSLGSLGFGAYVKFLNIMPTNVDQELHITPGAYVKYTL